VDGIDVDSLPIEQHEVKADGLNPFDWCLRLSVEKTGDWLVVDTNMLPIVGQATISFGALKTLPHSSGKYFGGIDKWAVRAGVSEATLKRHIIALIEHGFVADLGRERTKTGVRLRSSYALNAPRWFKGMYGVLPTCYMGLVDSYAERAVLSIVIQRMRIPLSIGAKHFSDATGGINHMQATSNLFYLPTKELEKVTDVSKRAIQMAVSGLVAKSMIVVDGDSVYPFGIPDDYLYFQVRKNELLGCAKMSSHPRKNELSTT